MTREELKEILNRQKEESFYRHMDKVGGKAQ